MARVSLTFRHVLAQCVEIRRRVKATIKEAGTQVMVTKTIIVMTIIWDKMVITV